MDVLNDAIVFAVEKHSGQTRKMSDTPYILHPLEVAAIIAAMTADRATMAAGVLHDVVEDCGVSPQEILTRFGARVAELVAYETEDRSSLRPPEETWRERKEKSLCELRQSQDREVQILWLADKLSNLRSLSRAYAEQGDAVWQEMHQKDPAVQGWYYRSVASAVRGQLGDTAAYREYSSLLKSVFGKEGKA